MGLWRQGGGCAAVVSIFLSILAISTPVWIAYHTNNVDMSRGLFSAGSGNRYYQITPTTAEEVAAAMNIIAQILLAASVIALVFIERGYDGKLAKFLPSGLNALADLLILIGMAYYTVHYADSLQSADYRFGFSFYCGWVAFGFDLPAAIALFVKQNE